MNNCFNELNSVLKNDGVIAFVTDTVWGIGCLPSSAKAVKKIYDIKNREAKKPLILMSYDCYPLLEYLKQPVEKEAQMLMKKFFPGALTLVLPKSDNTPDYVTSGLNTVGVRVPDSPVFAEICKNVDGGVLATTSANISGESPALTYKEAMEKIGKKVDFVLRDFGEKAKGHASTVAGFKDDKVVIFRQGDVKI